MQHRHWPSKLWTVRHGESLENAALRDAIQEGLDHVGVVGRVADVPLTDRGEQQAREVGRWFASLPEDARPARVLCSPLVRARRTAELIVQEGGLDVRIEVDERLREKDLGRLEKLTHSGVEHLDRDEADLQRELGKFYYRPPGGESWCDLILRLRSLLEGFVLHEETRPVLFVSHQAVVTCLRYVFQNLDERGILEIDRQGSPPNCSISEYTVTDDAGRPRIDLQEWSGTAAPA